MSAESYEKVGPVSPTSLRVSVATAMSKANKIEDLDSFTRGFMKHTKNTSLNYYIVEGIAASKVIEYSTGISEIFGLDTEEENVTKELIEKLEKVCFDDYCNANNDQWIIFA